MEKEGRARLAWFDGEVTLHRSADMRYGEQVFEIPVGLDDVDWASPALAANLADRFHAAHERLYTYALRDQEAVLVNARLSVIGRLPQVERAVPDVSGTRSVQGRDAKSILAAGPRCRCSTFSRSGPDQCVVGPAVVESDTTTVLLRSGDAAQFRRAGLAGGDN